MTVRTLRQRASGAAANLTAAGELVAAVLPALPGSGPSSAADVTTEWLTRHLASTTPGAAAQHISPLGGTTGTTDRQRLSVEWNDSGRAAGLPDHLFLKSTPLSAKNRTMVAALGMAVNEARFYNEAADELGSIAPRAWYARAGVGARFLIVLEDIVAAGGRPYALADICDIDHAQGLIDAFATLHARFWESPRLVGDLSWVRTWSTRPGYGVLKTFYSRGLARTRSARGVLLDDLRPGARAAPHCGARSHRAIPGRSAGPRRAGRTGLRRRVRPVSTLRCRSLGCDGDDNQLAGPAGTTECRRCFPADLCGRRGS
jgi:hypothetical protein